jgi:hypothetical protein
MKSIFSILLFGYVVLLSSCYYDKEEELYPNSNTDTISVAKWGAHIKPIMDANCATSGCHAAGGQSPDLSTYQGVFNSKDRVKARAVDGNPSPMPASGLMNAGNRDKIAKWIAAGAKND